MPFWVNVFDDDTLPSPGEGAPGMMQPRHHPGNVAGGAHTAAANLEIEKAKHIAKLNEALAARIDPETNKIPNIEKLREPGGLLDPEALARFGLKIVEQLDEVWVKAGGSLEEEKCGRKENPCGTIQLGISRSSMNAKVYVGKGRYSGEGNVNLKIDGRSVEIFSRPAHLAIINCDHIWPLIDPLHSHGSTGLHDFQVQNCNIQGNNGDMLDGDVEAANIQLPAIRKVWSPAENRYVHDPQQLQLYEQQQLLLRARQQQLKKSKKRKRRTRQFIAPTYRL